MLAGSLIAVRSRLLPTWLGWVGMPVAIAMFTPVGFFAACAAGAWIIVASVRLSMTDESAFAAAEPERVAPIVGAPSGGSGLGPRTIGT